MFENIGEKIKNLVSVIFTVEVVLFAILILFSFAKTNIIGIFISIAGVFLSWVSLFVMYGFGELISNSQKQTKQNERIIYLLSSDVKEDAEDKNNRIREKSIRKTDSSGFNRMSVE